MAMCLTSGDESWLYLLLATAFLKQGCGAEALPYARPPVTKVPDARNYLRVLRDVHCRLGDRDQASITY